MLALLVLPAAVRVLSPLGGHSAGLAIADDPVCGNGIVEPGEQCDGGPDWLNDCCRTDCRLAAAGDNCSDGNACNDPDTCDGAGHCVGQEPLTICPGTECRDPIACDPQVGCLNPPKPDGTVCDDGDPCSVGDQCASGQCVGSYPSCGDGVIESCEQCDDGNTQNRDGCSASCKLEARPRACQTFIGMAGWFVPQQRLNTLQGCRNTLNAGKRSLYFDRERTQQLTDPADCPNEFSTATRLLRSEKTGSRWVLRLCNDAALGVLRACSNTLAGLINDTGDAGCLPDSIVAGVDAALALEYGQVTPGDTASINCQSAIARAGATYMMTALRRLQGCRNLLLRPTNVKLYFDAAKTQRLVDPADCANEYGTQVALIQAGKSARTLIAGSTVPKCTDALVSSLGLCASSIDGLVTADGTGGCLITGHMAIVDALIDAQY